MGTHEVLAGTLGDNGSQADPRQGPEGWAWPASYFPRLCVMMTFYQLLFLRDLAYLLDLETEAQLLHQVSHECFPIPFAGQGRSTGVESKAREC